MAATLSVTTLLGRYLTSAKFAAKSDTGRPIDTGRKTHHLKPLLGKILVEALTQEHIRRAFNGIRDGQTQKEMPGDKPGGIIRVHGGARLHHCLVYCDQLGRSGGP